MPSIDMPADETPERADQVTGLLLLDLLKQLARENALEVGVRHHGVLVLQPRDSRLEARALAQ